MENTDKIQDKVVSMLDALQQGAATVGDNVVKYTPDVVDATLWVIRIDGANTLITALLGLIISGYIFIKLSRKGYQNMIKYNRYINNNPSDPDYNETQKYRSCDTPAILQITLACLSLAMLIPSVLSLLSVWNWVSIFEPKLYLTKQIIDSVIK